MTTTTIDPVAYVNQAKTIVSEALDRIKADSRQYSQTLMDTAENTLAGYRSQYGDVLKTVDSTVAGLIERVNGLKSQASELAAESVNRVQQQMNVVIEHVQNIQEKAMNAYGIVRKDDLTKLESRIDQLAEEVKTLSAKVNKPRTTTRKPRTAA